jgi:hypothetical protein
LMISNNNRGSVSIQLGQVVQFKTDSQDIEAT